MKIHLIVEENISDRSGLFFGDRKDARWIVNIRYIEFESNECEYVERLRTKYETICRRLKFVEMDV
jgi:hypothetical protein